MNLQSEAMDLNLILDSKGHGGNDMFKGILRVGAGAKRRGVVLLHGRNAHPDGAVVGHMRKSLHGLGYATLSIENPVPKESDEFPDYVADIQGENYVFPEAYARIRASISELKKRGLGEIVLLGFSMGARMQAAYLARNEASALPVLGLVALSGGVNGVPPLNIASSLGKVAVPVLDVCGGGDADVASTAEMRKTAYESGNGKSYTQVVIKGSAPHNFSGREDELQECVHKWMVAIAPA
ncbi:MAG: alpha/beta hydrolase family protein [Burkholderiales bacterium]|nr:alpha/beta hydrolase family protein [Burkholderiales bacterium]